ncbi:MAG: sialidase family protein [Pseudomonadota bacterium]
MSDTDLLIGTTKGAFILRDGQMSGPHCGGWPINHLTSEPETGRIWAGGGNDFFGVGVWRSDDGGETWTISRLARGQIDDWAAAEPEFAAMVGWTAEETPFDREIEAIWLLRAAHGRLWAGGKPGVLFVSDDGGESWAGVAGINDHESRKDWNPGAAGLVLHTLVTHPQDPARLWAGISAAGVFASEDGGQSWERRNRLSNAAACDGHSHPAAPSGGETGHCVHNMGLASDETLYQQNHHGVWRSHDGGRHWDDITEGLPSTFGFPIGVHPNDPAMIWTIPLNGDSAGRFPPDAAAAVWKSNNGGESWVAKRRGLPQSGCFFTVLRQAMAVGPGAEVFFGTNSGSIFASYDEGESWDEIARHLPTVLSVEAA